jgi:hypothetical protein
MKRPPEYYTLWNQAVEAVEIYLANNPQELTENQLHRLFSFTHEVLTGNASTGIVLDLYDLRLHALIGEYIPSLATL